MVMFKLRQKGYTITELVVIISVIGILAGISYVAYGGWQKSVTETQLKSDLKMAAAAMENYRNFSEDGYPVHVNDVFTPSKGVTISGGAYASVDKYSISAVGGKQSYKIDQTAAITESNPLIVFLDASRIDYPSWTDLSGYGNDATFDNPSSILINNWLQKRGFSNYYSASFNRDHLAVTPINKFNYDITWSIWLKRSGIDNSGNVFMGKNYPSFSFHWDGSKVYVRISDSISMTPTINPVALVANANNGYAIDKSYWNHLVFTRKFDSISNKTKLIIYKNGAKLIEKEFVGHPTDDQSQKFTIGAQKAKFADFNQRYEGEISMVKIFNCTLSDDEVKYEYSIDKHKYQSHSIDGLN